MKSRADILKRLELGVQQEIKNYNDSLSTILLRLNYLKDDIEAAERESLENDAILLSKLKELEINFNLVRDARDDSVRKMNRDILIQNKYYEELKRNLNFSIGNAIEALRVSELNRNTISDLSEKIDSFQDEISGHSKYIAHELESISYQLKKEVAKSKDEILSRPSDSIEFKKQLEEKIASHAVDVQGLLKEIRSRDKATMILEKKIEHLYTLVGRLQKEGTP